MVVNAILAAMAKHAEMSGVTVYHVASSVANPIRIGEISKIMFQHFKRNPYIDHKGNPVRLPNQVTCVNTMDNYRQGLERVFHSPNNVSCNGILYLFKLYIAYLSQWSTL